MRNLWIYSKRALGLVSLLVLGQSLPLPTLASQEITPKEVEQLIKQLGSTQFNKREEAARQLEELTFPGLEMLARGLEHPDLEVKRRCATLIRKIENRLAQSHLVRTLKGHKGRVNQAAITPDSKMVVAASWDGTLSIWDLATGKLERKLEGHEGWVHCVGVSPDGRRVLSGGSEGELKLWELAAGKMPRAWAKHPGEVWEAAFAPDSRQAVTSGSEGEIRQWDVATGAVVRRLVGHAARVWTVAYSPDGRLIASGGGSVLVNLFGDKKVKPDFAIRLWDATTGMELRRLEGHTGDVRRVRFARDGMRLVSAGFDSTVRVWAVDTGKELRCFTGHQGFVEFALFTPDGRSVFSCEGGQIKNGQFILGENPSGISDHAIRFWDVETGKEWLRLKGHFGPILSMALAPDGRHFVTSGDDQTIKVWKMPQRAPASP
jgi:WD40 repeat protein